MAGQDVRGALQWMAMAKGLSQVVAWAITLVVIRILSPADYGLFAMATVLVLLAEMLKEMGLGSALVQAKNLTDHQLRQVFTLILMVNAFLYLTILSAVPLIAGFFREDALELLIPVAALQFPTMALETIPEAMLSRRMNFRSKALIAMSGAFTNSIVTLTCALNGMGVWSLIFGGLSATLMRLTLYAITSRIVYMPTLDFKGVGKMASFGGYVTFSRFLIMLLIQSGFFIVGRMLGKEALGIYTVAYQLATLPMQKVSGMLNEIGLAAFSKIQDERAQYAANYSRAMSILAFVAFPVFWGMAGVADSMTLVVLGDKWGDVVFPLQAIALITPLQMIFNTTMPALLGMGRADTFLGNLIILNIFMPIAYYFGSLQGVDGVAFGWLLLYPPLFAITQIRTSRQLGVRAVDLVLASRNAVLSAFLMLLIVLATDWLLDRVIPDIARLALLVGLGILVYFLASMRFNRERLDDIRALVSRN